MTVRDLPPTCPQTGLRRARERDHLGDLIARLPERVHRLRATTVLLCPYVDAEGRKLALRGMTVDRETGLVHGVETRTREPRSIPLADVAHMHLTGDAHGRRRAFDCRQPGTRDAKHGDNLPGA